MSTGYGVETQRLPCLVPAPELPPTLKKIIGIQDDYQAHILAARQNPYPLLHYSDMQFIFAEWKLLSSGFCYLTGQRLNHYFILIVKPPD